MGGPGAGERGETLNPCFPQRGGVSDSRAAEEGGKVGEGLQQRPPHHGAVALARHELVDLALHRHPQRRPLRPPVHLLPREHRSRSVNMTVVLQDARVLQQQHMPPLVALLLV